MGRCSRMLQCRTSRAQPATSPFGCTRYLQRPVARSAETTEAAFIRSIQAPRFVRAGRAATSSRDRAERIAAGNRTLLAVLRQGYLLDGKVVRLAEVHVSLGPAVPEPGRADSEADGRGCQVDRDDDAHGDQQEEA
jgi:hypothetical protein